MIRLTYLVTAALAALWLGITFSVPSFAQESGSEFPPLQAPETYNLTGILDAMKKGGHPSDCLTPIVPMPRCSSTARHSPL